MNAGTTSTYSADYVVTGMTCSHCVMSVTEEVEGIASVAHAKVDLDSGALVVVSDSPISVDEVRAAVEEAGYRLA